MFNKNSPGARFVRTFVLGLAGVAAGLTAIDWATDWRVGATTVVLGIIAAFLAGALAALQVIAGWTANTPLMKGLVTFAQMEAAGLATLGINELTRAAAVTFAHAVWTVTVAAIMAAIAAFAQNASEDVAR